ncbi:MAG: DUF1611 domain-containing protein [Bacteroidales bacterium]|nr:DUF1611 domain-containing protein [Bacteroidales bacterium]
MNQTIDGPAIVYCQGAFNTPNGKTAHGLVRFTSRYNVIAVIDSGYAGQDAGEVLDGRKNGIPVVKSVEDAVVTALSKGIEIKTMVIGIAPDGGRFEKSQRKDILTALEIGLNIDSGLHDFLGDDPEFGKLADYKGLRIRDIRKTPNRNDLHFFTGDIDKVTCLKLAVLGTDSAIGKRTTAWIIVHGFRNAGKKAELIGTGQTAWMQGAKYSFILDSLINDFVSGEIEHAVVEAWKNESPDAVVLEGQGSLLNPAYPGGFELLAAGRPDFVILQHAPKRVEYDGFPGIPLHPLKKQIDAIEMISGKKVIAITLNHENMKDEEILPACENILKETGIPAFDVLKHGPEGLMKVILPLLKKS